jgi:hypothetical protein
MASARLSIRAGIHPAGAIFVSIITFIKRSVKKKAYQSTTGRYLGISGKSWKKKKVLKSVVD